MNRNAESRFALNPTVEKPRSIFDRSNQIKTSFNNGQLIPVEVWNDVMPGDTIKIDTAAVIRMTSALKTPVMDNCYADIFYFYVPYRLLWEHWEEFMGDNDDPWAQQTEYQIPQIKAPTGGWAQGTLADYMGIPTKVGNISVDRLPFNAYCKIYNDYFRDQNVQYALNFNKGDTTLEGVNTGDYTTDCALGGLPAQVNKFHDYFTSMLPEPIKNADPILLPLGQSANVIGNGNGLGLTNGTWERSLIAHHNSTSGGYLGESVNNTLGAVGTVVTQGSNYESDNNIIGVSQNPDNSGLIADLSTAQGATLQDLYNAMALFKLYQTDARGGTRINEIIYAHYGVKSPDARLQRAEYLGGKRIALNVDQVEQTAPTSSTNLGDLAAYSQTSDASESFTYSATDHGVLMCLICTRCEHSYQQGINRMWSRKNRTDFYFPGLANIAEMGVRNEEIFAQGTEEDKEIIGYQEAWADYRYKPSRVSGQMRSNATGTLDSWHYADDYETLPALSAEWMREPTSNMDRTLAVTSEVSNQIIADIYFNSKWTRVMPLYSIPGIPV